ncbi:histidine kinase [Clostridium sp. CS001]|uniref:sensor histidine kinase n=1 Tax=Clostridium sp. CS001 TaxID=2880648 RepID=UPI001CF5B045|nr:histidine kinase [Clostridium sp. CS001]MCB2289641.1 histidine kinase [Clostridium sp. CS001]
MKLNKKNKLNNIKVKKESKQINYIDQHFLFNTLNSILSLCRDDSEKARKVVLELSSYLRFNFNVADEGVFLYEEIECIKAYLYIQEIRFGERLKVRYDIQEDINFLIPQNSLYNLIDNAVNHGILKKNQGGTVTFIVMRDGEEIAIKIQDDGVGMEENQIMQILNDKNYGSFATSKVQFNDLYNAKVEVISKLHKGTCIMLHIPIENIKCE